MRTAENFFFFFVVIYYDIKLFKENIAFFSRMFPQLRMRITFYIQTAS